MGVMPGDYGSYALVLVISANAFLVYPYLSNIAVLTRYVDNLAQDKRVEAPDLSLLGAVGELSQAVSNLHRSAGRKKQQMESVIAEREILVDTIPDILFMVDEFGSIVQTNGAARQRFGQNLASRDMREVLPNELLQKALEEVKVNFKRKDVEFFLETPIEAYYRARIDRFPVHSPGGIALIITLHDITELKQVEQLRADFVANASHEIRTPLASLIGFIETLQGPAKDDPQARDQFLKIMSEQANRMSRLVNDLLSLSKLEMNVHTVPDGTVDVSVVVKKVRDNIDWLLVEKDIKLTIEVEEGLPEIQGEDSEIFQVLENLIGNAIKYGKDNGRVNVRLFTTRTPPIDKHFQGVNRALGVAVTDEGEGIPKEHLSRLTERFYRVTNSKSKKVGGTGLGLAIVKHILNRHHGVLTVESELGVGSTFTAYFQVKKSTIRSIPV